MEADSCTLFPEGTWSYCCKRHDRRYENNRLTRRQADILLKRCVAKENKLISYIMYLGVRTFGWLYYNKGR